MKLSHLATAAALTLAAFTQVHAAPLLLGAQVEVKDSNNNAFTPSADSNGLYENVGFSLNGSAAKTASAGQFVLNHASYPAAANASWTQFLSFCLEPDVVLSAFDNPYTVNSIASAGYNAVNSDISELWGRYFGSVTNDVTAAAFQVALWELAFGATDKNLETGDFVLTSGGSVKTTAQGWLSSLNGTGPKAQGLLVLVDNLNNNVERQDLITQGPVEVPEPAMLALLGIGLAGVGLARRRQKPGQPTA